MAFSFAKKILVANSMFFLFTINVSADTTRNTKTNNAFISPLVYSQIKNNPEAPVWVHLKEKADLSISDKVSSKKEKNKIVYSQLKETAERSQKGIIAILKKKNIRYESFYITNALLVYLPQNSQNGIINLLSKRSDVSKIMPNPKFNMLTFPQNVTPSSAEKSNGVEWNINTIHAPQAWEMGYKGSGVVVAGNDTGVTWSHPTISGKYRGNSSGTVTHSYNWFDGISGKTTPYDDHGHGTFTVGEMVGDDGNNNQIGAAPEAQWIGCKNMDASGAGTPKSYTKCFEWFIAPTDSNGLNPNPDYSPDIINNSWSCPASEGCDKETLHEIVNNVQAAGIMLVFAAGNEGPSCGTIAEAPNMYPEIMSVGATTSSNTLADFSSRGPSSYDGSIRPNVSAPGEGVRSCVGTSGYTYMSGTSMAAPLVVGSTALLWSAVPDLMGDIDGTKKILELSASFKRGFQCKGDKKEGKNNMFGYGIVNAEEAILSSLSEAKHK